MAKRKKLNIEVQPIYMCIGIVIGMAIGLSIGNIF